MFEHGHTTADSGTGYGLSIVSEIIEAHGWEISLADTETGTRFEIQS
ncbi:MAG: ATP-binding protein [Halobacteriales archaeon]|nr:ATP-binding protein [Halobacteriales archaeon]